MSANVEYAILAFGSLFAILSPFATVPTFLALSDDETPADQMSMAARACVLAFIVLALFSLLGEPILAGFRVSVPALQIAGGLVVLRVAFDLIQGERRRLTPPEQSEARDKADITVTPLAVPILCGPGTITTGIILGAEADGTAQHATLIVVTASIYAVTYAFLTLAVHSSRWMGTLTLRVLGRLMGMLLAGVAVQFVLNGVQAALITPLAR